MLDSDGKILLGNDKFSELMGLTDQEYLGKTLQDTPLAQYAEAITSELKCVVNDKVIKASKVLIDLEDRKMWLNVVKSPVVDNDEKVIGAACVMRNIDKEVQSKIQRNTFLASLSHDLKTPIAAQIRALDLTLNNAFGYLNDSQRDILEQTLVSNKQLHHMSQTFSIHTKMKTE